MSALLGLAIIAVLLTIIPFNKIPPLVTRTAVPIIAVLKGVFGLTTGKLIVDGIRSIAPVTVMFIFAILFIEIVSNIVMADIGARSS